MYVIKKLNFISFSLVLVNFIIIDAKTENSELIRRLLRSVANDNHREDYEISKTPEISVDRLIIDIINKNLEEEDEILNDADDEEDSLEAAAELATSETESNTESYKSTTNYADDDTDERTTYGTLRPLVPNMNDTRQGICRRYLRHTEYVEVTTTGIKELFTPHYVFNFSKCGFNQDIECRRPWYFTPVIPYYETNRVWKEIDVCCEGYVRDKRRPFDDKGRLLCAPVCEESCIKSTCTAPNTCTCILGYKKLKGNDTACIPHCLKNCGGLARGECVSPETCLCKRGFIYQEERLNRCVTHCPKACVNSVCSGPATCKCQPGFKRHTTHRHICVPICKQDCKHGECVEPSKCVCHKGYQLVDGTCVATCDKYCGVNGTCVDTGTLTCICDTGYTFDRRIQECVPRCDNCSVGGVCVGPNNCKCFRDFIKNEEGDCIFACSFECGLGRCVGKDKCLCPKGYVFNKTADGPKCTPYCQGCELGECISPSNCQCPRGYVYHIPRDGEDKTIRCIKTVNEFRYYDDKVCKSIYDDRKRLWEEKILKKRRRIAKWKLEEERKNRKRQHEEKMRKEKQKNDKKVKQQPTKPVKRQSKDSYTKKRLFEEKQEYEVNMNQYDEYRTKTENKPSVTWKNFVRLALASIWFGPFGIVFW